MTDTMPSPSGVASYLRNEKVFRVELDRSWAQTPRISFVEALDVADARAMFTDAPVRVIEVRAADEGDADELYALIESEEEP